LLITFLFLVIFPTYSSFNILPLGSIVHIFSTLDLLDLLQYSMIFTTPIGPYSHDLHLNVDNIVQIRKSLFRAMLKSGQSVLVIFFVVSCHLAAPAQDLKQTIRGIVMDNETKMPLFAATIAVYRDSELLAGSTSDPDGSSRIENIPIERYTVVSSYLGYRQAVISNYPILNMWIM
jgi:hypothetical protein